MWNHAENLTEGKETIVIEKYDLCSATIVSLGGSKYITKYDMIM